MIDAEWIARFEETGSGIVPQMVSSESLLLMADGLEGLIQSNQPGVLSSRGIGYGIRNVLDLLPEVVEWMRPSGVGELATRLCGSEAALVRALFFDKPPERSWTLPWHRDRAIALREPGKDLPIGFSNPTRKSGIPHVNADPVLLAKMVTIRISLDPMHSRNGPLVVLPGSHKEQSEMDDDLSLVNPGQMQAVHCAAGDVFVMRPLLAHSSLKSDDDCGDRRRVLHLEFSGVSKLPGGLEWRHYLPIS